MPRVNPYSASISATLKSVNVPVIPRSQCEADFCYSVQRQAPAGNWVTRMSTDKWNDAAVYANMDAASGHATRIVDNSK